MVIVHFDVAKITKKFKPQQKKCYFCKKILAI